MLKRWSFTVSLTARSANLSLHVASETLIPSAAVESRRLSCYLKLRRLLPWIKFKIPCAPPFPPPKRLRTLSKIGFLRKIRLFRRRTILPATSSPTDDEYELPRRSLSSRSPNSRKIRPFPAPYFTPSSELLLRGFSPRYQAAAAVASLLAVVVACFLSERIRQ